MDFIIEQSPVWTNAFFFIPTFMALYRRRWLQGIIWIITAIVSFLYHLRLLLLCCMLICVL